MRLASERKSAVDQTVSIQFPVAVYLADEGVSPPSATWATSLKDADP